MRKIDIYNKEKLWRAFLYNENKLPRKIKKKILGIRLNNTKLKKLLERVQIIKNEYPERATILPYRFCPKCGCEMARSTGNMAGWPELWEEITCARCVWLVEAANNSPYIHCLECAEDNYEIH